MTLKQSFTKTCFLISFFLILLTGCEKEEIVSTRSIAQVEVVLSPKSLGDQGYNDKILRGLQRAAAQYGFTLAIHIPEKKSRASASMKTGLPTP